MVQSLDEVTAFERALVIGIGGGGDILATVPTARFLELLDLEVYLGGVAWQPVPRDVRAGPRSIAELIEVEPIADHVAIAQSGARTVDGVELPEGAVASKVDQPVFVLDICDGPSPLADSVSSVIEEHAIDLVIGVDAGGDVLAEGDELGIRSPLTDAIGLTLLGALDVATILGVLGYGSDGELTEDELDHATAELARKDGVLGAWGITPQVRGELESLLEVVETEASRLPVDAAKGEFGTFSIRDGRRDAHIGPTSMITLYFDPQLVADRSAIVDLLKGLTDIEMAAAALREAGIHTELDTEHERLERQHE